MSSTANRGKEKNRWQFTIDSENKITGYTAGEAVPEGNAERFTTEGELAELAAHWPAARLAADRPQKVIHAGR